ncbi:maleylpyruvate isomerase family mycothiol-dependent enzyme [Micromonospora sp. RTGN7]|uniref:maleylpyruvate isomerase family mycothiol-dependent enzyme n=1 Tax=Micromonospora sp. RTGN7 TaxID=3016526 RepID=UPI0029FEE714|nr:maleylpyruvate isomerase family mycothiol-dependent enzyme [Micromonospora sp. RTGN7]
MKYESYLRHLRIDSERLAALAADFPDRRVPTCPGWNVLGVVRHLAEVYEHKILCMELGRDPVDGERSPVPETVSEVLARYLDERDALFTLLSSRNPNDMSYTWFPPDQSVGFWYRRMAHETVIHRVDVELACGRKTPLDPGLATDGIAELLGFLTHSTDRPPRQGCPHRTVELRSGGQSWYVSLRERDVQRPAGTPVIDACLEGEPEDLLLALWGRHPLDSAPIRVTGDASTIAELQIRLREET